MGKEKSKKHKKDGKRSKEKHKKEKHKKRRRDSSSDSDSSSGSDREEHKRMKSEQLAKKVVSHLQKASAKSGTDTFVWGKKVEKELQQGTKLKEISIFQDKNRQAERMEELERVRKRQADREMEKAQREEELSMMQRVRAMQEAMESEAKEEEFYLKSLVAKSERRLRDGRPTPIDLIAKNLHLTEEYEADMVEPWKYLDGMLLDDTQELVDAIHDYEMYDKYDDLHKEFWTHLASLADLELIEAKKRDAQDRAHLRGAGQGARDDVGDMTAEANRGLHPDVEAEIEQMLAGQPLKELLKMELSVSSSLASGFGDTEYWQAVMDRLQSHKAKAHVRDAQMKLMGRVLSGMAAKEAGAPDGVKAAMGWEKEERGVVVAKDVPGDAAAGTTDMPPPPPCPPKTDVEALLDEEIDLDDGASSSDGEGRAEEGAGSGGRHEGGGEKPANEAGGEGGVQQPISPSLKHKPKPVPAWRPGGAAATEEDDLPGSPAEEEPGADSSDGEEYVRDEDDGRYSPPPVDPRLIAGQDIVHEEEDYRQLEMMRQRVLLREAARYEAGNAGSAPGGRPGHTASYRPPRNLGRGAHPVLRNLVADEAEDAAAESFRTGKGPREEELPDNDQTLASFKMQSMKMMGGDEADRDFTGEVPLESQVYWWHEKYKPRKPKYFNRVHTGYEWNKYNQTHYDSDNPPPKTVQGYKFNILYHDLIDRRTAPTYKVERDPDSADNSTCILRFTAGPPYEDIAFRIIRKEWEYSHKRGFKCTFERGILHLYFNFVRPRYRR